MLGPLLLWTLQKLGLALRPENWAPKEFPNNEGSHAPGRHTLAENGAPAAVQSSCLTCRPQPPHPATTFLFLLRFVRFLFLFSSSWFARLNLMRLAVFRLARTLLHGGDVVISHIVTDIIG
eukprot:SAG31_NODE_3135_length_4636_cov_7.918448_5_plen_121_part_00